MNGGLVTGKTTDNAKEYMPYDYHSTDDMKDKPGKWHWEKGHGMMCWISASTASQVKRMSDLERALIDSYVHLHRDINNGTLEI